MKGLNISVLEFMQRKSEGEKKRASFENFVEPAERKGKKT